MEKAGDENKLIDLPIGSTFVWCNQVYAVKERHYFEEPVAEESWSCRGCAFYISAGECSVCSAENRIPVCDGFLRKDEKDVIFVRAGEVQG